MSAHRTYHPLDLIHSEKAFAKVLRRSNKDDFCESCLIGRTNLKICSKCKAVKYCSIDCQKSDWRDHKLECPHMKNLLPRDPSTEDIVRLLGRIILKIKGKQWKTFRTSILNTVVTFDDLESYIDDTNKDPLEMLMYKQIKKGLEKFIGKENLPEEDEVMEIIGKVNNNLITQVSPFGHVGLFLFLGSSRIKYGCIPTTQFEIKRNILNVIAIKEISKESETVTVNAGDFFSSQYKYCNGTNIRRCICVECTLPFGKSLLTKILNEDEAFSLILKTETFIDTILTEKVPIIGDNINCLDKLLKEHIGVLGDTNAQHMRLLALKCFKQPDHPRKKLENLKVLEKLMSKVFGEFYKEMISIYMKIVETSMLLGKSEEALPYKIKVLKFRKFCTIQDVYQPM